MRRLIFMLMLAALALTEGCDRSTSPQAPAGRITAGLSYTITPPEGFAPLVQGDKTLSWTLGGLPVEPDAPRIVLTRSSKVFPANEGPRRVAAEQLIRGVNNMKNHVILETTPVTIDGMPGYASTAKALASTNNAPVRVYCAALFAADGTFYIMGYDGGDDSAAHVDLFRTAAHSLAVK